MVAQAKWLNILFVLSMSAFASAAIPDRATMKGKMLPDSDLTLEELLLLPEPNRLALSIGKNEFYPLLIEKAFDEKAGMDLRWKSLTLAAAIRKQGSEPDMMKAASHKSWFMRNAALLAIQSYSPKAAEQLALKLLNDNALVVRSAAVSVLTKSTDQQVRNRLWAEFHDQKNVRNKQNLWIKEQILKHLAAYPQQQELSIFKKLAEDQDVKFKKIASNSLKNLERPSSAPLR